MNRNGPLPENSEKSTRPALPADLELVRADDELLDALRGPNPSLKGDDWVTQVLVAWRDEVDTEPLPRLVDTDTATALVRGPRRPGRWRVFLAAARRIAGRPLLPWKDRP